MSTIGVNQSGRPRGVVEGEVGEIRTAVAPIPIDGLSIDQLFPGEAAVSLAPLSEPRRSAIAPLTNFLGPVLTVANPVWSNDPVPGLRALEKLFVEQSLQRAPEDRRVCLDAIVVIEKNVKLRLRLQQMRMSQVEMDIKSEEKVKE